jgi:predicted HTH transcriptional regulator
VPDSKLCEHIYLRKEDRGREYKAPMPWTDDLTKAKITRAILAMSNTIDGGVIIVGMRELEDKTYDPVGLSKADASTFNHDTIADYLKEYADPYAQFTVESIECGGKEFVCIQVTAFDDYPVICKKNGRDLEKGRIYVRSRTKNESAPVSSYAEMREVIDLAMDKVIKKSWSRLPCSKLVFTPPPEDAKEKFAEQRKDLQ